jgi:hypothetical protein
MGGETIVVRRGEHGWQVGNEETADLTSAMVLADLLAADLGTPAPPPAGPPRHRVANHRVANHGVANHGALREEDEAARLAVTVAQLVNTGQRPFRSPRVIIHMLWITMG